MKMNLLNRIDSFSFDGSPVQNNDGDDREPIGSVSFNRGSIVATLWDRNEWTVTIDGIESSSLKKFFTAKYQDQYYGPSYGYYGQYLLRMLAKDLGGTVQMIKEFPEGPPSGGDGVVY